MLPRKGLSHWFVLVVVVWLLQSSTVVRAQVAPTITTVTNGASNTLPEMPSSGIAQGSLFVIKGANMGPFVVATTTAFPLSTSLAGTSVAISAGGRTIPAIMFYSSAGQVSAIVPSSTPVGVASVTVTYNGRTSASFPMTIVQSTLGIFTATTIGSGDAIATLGSTFLSPLNAANPGEVVAFWGTGLGPVTSDETGPAQQADMTNVPVEAYVAGKPAEVVFRGRNSCCSAIDTSLCTYSE